MIGFLAQTTQPVITGLDVVDKVGEFYQDAWGNLMWFIMAFLTILAAAMGLVPWWMGRRQEKQLRFKEKEMLARIGDAHKEAMAEISILKKEFKEGSEELKEEIKARVEGALMTVYSSVGWLAKGQGNVGTAVHGFVWGIRSAMRLQQYEGVKMMLGWLHVLIKDEPEKGRKQLIEVEVTKEAWTELKEMCTEQAQKELANLVVEIDELVGK